MHPARIRTSKRKFAPIILNDLPEILSVPVGGGLAAYLDWVATESTAG